MPPMETWNSCKLKAINRKSIPVRPADNYALQEMQVVYLLLQMSNMGKDYAA